jgi:predicted alpha/beta-hydrolase family hydrolase
VPDQRRVATPHGDGELLVSRARSPRVTLVLGHGAGGGSHAPDLAVLARHLPRHGITVVRVEQPWRLAGRRVAPAPPVLDEAFVAAVDRLRPRTPLVVGGRSAGGRVACRTARRLGASGCLALAFPLHSPGRQQKSRLPELRAAGVPTLVVQGERDSFGRPDAFPTDIRTVTVPSADHSFAVPKTAPIDRDQALQIVVDAVLTWIVEEVV